MRLKSHARYFDPAVLYHVTSKTLRGEFFLHPSSATNEIILGVLGRAQHRWPQVELFAYVFMSNHFHLMLRGDGESVPGFVGFIKREISRRRGIETNSRGPMWQRRYEATALPSTSSQLKCLRYILEHGVKEGLVENPSEWPGIHCVDQVLSGTSRIGRWLNGTLFGKALFQARARKKRAPSKDDFVEEHSIELSVLPCFKKKRSGVVAKSLNGVVAHLVQKAADARHVTGRRVVGLRAILDTSPKTRRPVPVAPWFEVRQRQIVAWAKPREPEVRSYVRAYRDFQHAFRRASRAQGGGKVEIGFPKGGWRPPGRPSLLAA
jgi:REP element-mobilizing transposase RayT